MRTWAIRRAEILSYWSSDVGRARAGQGVDGSKAHCVACLSEDARLLDHARIVPLVLGGSDDPSNFILLCEKCHRAAPRSKADAAFFNWCRTRQATGGKKTRTYGNGRRNVPIGSVVEYWSTPEGRKRLGDDLDGTIVRCLACRDASDDGGLERCHIVAHSLGGKSEPRNLVLLCRRCHARSPMTKDERLLFDWCRRRYAKDQQEDRELTDELREIGVSILDCESAEPFIALAAEELDAGSHFGDDGNVFSVSTRAAIIHRAIQLRDASNT